MHGRHGAIAELGDVAATTVHGSEYAGETSVEPWRRRYRVTVFRDGCGLCMNFNVGIGVILHHSPGYEVYFLVLFLKIYFKCRESPRTLCPATNHMSQRITVGAAHGNREVRFLPSRFVLLDFSL